MVASAQYMRPSCGLPSNVVEQVVPSFITELCDGSTRSACPAAHRILTGES